MKMLAFVEYLAEVEKWLKATPCIHSSMGMDLTLQQFLMDQAPCLLVKWEQWFCRAKALEAILKVPVIAICGGKNAGKSTLTASLLSPECSTFVLRGGGRNTATHRFVLWCPLSWKEDEDRRTCLQELIQAAFNFKGKFEELGADIGQAHRQYNAQGASLESLYVPLVGYDKELDEKGLAILDCPDLDSPFDIHSRERTAQVRRDAVKNAASLCAGFIALGTQLHWQVAGWVDLVRFICEVGSEQSHPTVCITQCEGNPGEILRGVSNQLSAYGMPADKIQYLHSPYAYLTNGEHIKYLDSDGRPFDISSLYSMNNSPIMSEKLKVTLLENAENLKKTTLAEVDAVLKENEGKHEQLRDAIQSFLYRELCDTHGQLRMFMPVQAIEELVGEIGRRYRFSPVLSFDESYLEHPDKVIDLLGQVIPKKYKNADMRIPNIKQYRFVSNFESALSPHSNGDDLKQNLKDSWKIMLHRIHSDHELNGYDYADDLAEQAMLLGLCNENIVNLFFRLWKPPKRIYILLLVLSKICLNPNKSDRAAVMSLRETLQVAGLESLDPDSEHPLFDILQDLAISHVTALQNWLHDIVGVPREELVLDTRGGGIYLLEKIDTETLLPMNPLPQSCLPVLFEAQMSNIYTKYPKQDVYQER